MTRRTLLAATVTALLLGAPAAAAERVVIGDGHVDLGPRIVDGEWTVRIRDDTVEPPRWRKLRDVVLQARAAARHEVPEGAEFVFLGAPGDPVWLLPQVQQDGILWPGWNTQAPEIVDEVVREVTWRLHGVRGPGRFALFSTQDFGAPELLFSSSEPYPQELGIDVDTHVHGNWAFSAPGTYLLDIELTAATHSHANVRARDTLRVFVGDDRPEQAFAFATSSPHARSPDRDGGEWPLVAGAALLAALGLIGARLARRASAAAPSR
jgi:putative ABC transporter-associated repeat protein